MSEPLVNNSEIIASAPQREKDGRLKKGVVLNPTGRPKGSRNLSTLLDISIKRISKENGTPHDVNIVRKVISRAEMGDMKAVEHIWDRLEGKAPQKIDVTTDGQPLNQNVADTIAKVYGKPTNTPPTNLPTGGNS